MDEIIEELGNEIAELKHFGAMIHISIDTGNEIKQVAWCIDEQIRHFSERFEKIYNEISENVGKFPQKV